MRELTSHDLAAAHTINTANVPEVGDVTFARFVELESMAAISTGVFDDDGMLGFCIVLPPDTAYDSVNYRWFMDRYRDAFYLDRVAFAADARRQGLGTRLYDAVEQRIRDEHPTISRLTLEVNSNPPNGASSAFHVNRGFIELGRQDTPYGIEVAMMEKPLR